MNNLVLFAAHNTFVALLLALFVSGLTRVWRNPPVAHLLWLIVLLKFVVPPVVQVGWPALALTELDPARGQSFAGSSLSESLPATNPPHIIEPSTAQTTAPAAATGLNDYDLAASIPSIWIRLQPDLLWIWLGGAIVCVLGAAMRIVNFERRLQNTLPASDRLQRLARETAGKLGLQRVPDVRYVDCVAVPMLWCAFRRPTIVLPMRLMDHLDDRQAAMVLAHELAHLRRRDHWVRAIELLVSTIYWWNPLVRVIRRQLHQVEDVCCDGWVRWAFPDSSKRYAELLLHAAESLSNSQVGLRLQPASLFLCSLSLKARIQMILESRFAPRLSKKSMFITTLFATLLLPTFVRTATPGAAAAANKDASATQVGTTFLAKLFKYRVPFETGLTETSEGGRIDIREVRGTRPKIEVGGQYLVRGKYVLPPGERGALYFYASASGPWGKTASLDLQSTQLEKQEGDFELVHGMAGPGYFHLVLSDPKRYTRMFANVYFGNGDNVYRRSATDSSTVPVTDESEYYSHIVRFDQGVTRFENGDEIKIVEIRGTAATFLPGHSYRIKGTYKLASRDKATLGGSVTAQNAADGNSRSIKGQSMHVKRGDGTFKLYLPMTHRGWPHVSFYPADGGEGFGGNYFGTGDSVLKKWWGAKE
jgi:beta-lactamase regulating signal transducer with metallopeptidase domain